MLRADPGGRVPVRSAREIWFDHAILALALVLLLSGFSTIVEGRDWWITTMLAATLTALACAVLRGIGLRAVAPIAVVIELIALSAIFVPDTLLAIVPTPATVRELAELVAAARDIIMEEQAPVAAAQPIVLVLAASFGLIVVVADVLLQRRRAAAFTGVLLLAVFATPALISGETPPVWLFVAVAALWLVLLRSRTTGTATARRGAAPAVLLGSASLAAAVAFPLVSPDVSAVAASWGDPPPTVFGRGINPMLELGQNLRRNSTFTALSYFTTFDEAQYLKVATLRDFTGRTWRPVQDGRGDMYEGDIAIKPAIQVEEGRTTITIKQLRSSLLPVPYPSLGTVEGLKGEWDFLRAGMTLTSRESGSRGQTYRVPSLDIQPTAEQMRSLRTTVGPSLERYLDLPDQMPAVIARTAERVTADADNDYDRATALQQFFRSGDFRYSETAPVADDYDGNGVDVIATFLEAKAGYCVHFSSAMAVMARAVGIPSRIAVGYAPGNERIVDGRTRYENTSDDLHAWTELYFQGVGWVRFDPTTSVGAPTRFAEPVTAAREQGPEERPEQEREVAPQREADRLDEATAAPVETSSTVPRSAAVTAFAVLVVGAVPWLVRTVRRRWRTTRGRDDVEPLWRELEDLARDLRIPASAADTPRGFAARLGARPGVDTASLAALLRRVEQARFSQVAPDGDGVAELASLSASLRAGASARARLLATVLPQSLAGRAPVVRLAEPGTLAP